MTCKDCINHGACSLSGAPKFADKQNVEIVCRLFKSTAEWARVIRCERCKFSSENSGDSAEVWCRNPNPLVRYIDVPKDFFCPYGRKVWDDEEDE